MARSEMRALLAELNTGLPAEADAPPDGGLTTEIREHGFGKALETYVRRVVPEGITVRFRNLAHVDVPSGTAENLFRIAQEAVQNTIKHARAGHIWISFESRGTETCMRIEDDGAGIPDDAASRPNENEAGPESTRIGLRSMKSRARAIGGAFEIGARPGGGTIVSVQFASTPHRTGTAKRDG